MIDPISAGAAAGALAEITAGMTGMSISDAYDQRMTDSYDPYDPTSDGLHVGYGNYTKETPAISGDTENTIIDSSESDPKEAWLDWMHDGGSVDSTTGGAVLGSTGETINYSLMEDDQGNVQAVQPIGIETDVAIVAIAQVLGVSMKVSEIDPVLGNKMKNAMLAAGVVYDKAKDVFTCWWDGVNILFPKKAIQAMEDLFNEEEIPVAGETGEEYRSDLDISPASQPVAALGSTEFWHNSSRATHATYIIAATGGRMAAFASSSSGQVAVLASDVHNAHVGTRYNYNYISGAPADPVELYAADSYTYDGRTVYYCWVDYPTQYGNNPAGPFSQSVGIPTNSPRLAIKGIAWTLIYGQRSGGGSYPAGMYESSAPSYTTDQLTDAGSIAGKKEGEQGITSTPVVPVNLPENTSDTTASEEDPVGATNPERTKENEKEIPVPLPIPNNNPSDPDVDLVDSTVVDAERINELVEDLANTVDPQAPQSTGEIMIPPFMPGTPNDPTDPSAGSQYPTIVPSSGSGFIHVYNPTPAEFVAFGQWLWVTYADATIEKIWNNPFDGVLGAHELYATPGVSGRDNIRSGFLVCPTSANLVPNRYTEIDCGSVVVPEFYGNYLDYSPYSQCYIYLPFIGINEVSIDDIVGHAVNIRYRVDSYSGACIAMIYVAKQGYRNLCYQFAGNCAVEVPLAGGSQAAIKAGMMQAEAYGRAAIQSAQIQKTAKIGTGIVQGAHSGAGAGAFNPVAGIVGGLLGGLAGGTAGYIQGAADYGAAKLSAGAMQEAARVANKSSVQHSGQFGASHGAMGLKVPFIIVRNPIQVKVTNYNKDYGFPAHKRVIIGGCTGYLRVKEVNVVSAHATNEEKIAIEEALKNGVYVS